MYSLWKKYLPDYEIKEWNEDNFDVNVIPYTREAYAAKKYAFGVIMPVLRFCMRRVAFILTGCGGDKTFR